MDGHSNPDVVPSEKEGPGYEEASAGKGPAIIGTISGGPLKIRQTLAALSLLGALSLPAAAADTYNLDPAHTTATFRIKHLNVSYFYGRFDDISGAMVIDETDPTKDTVQITVKTDSVDTHNDKRDQHLKSPDFCNAAQFPEITFKSTSVVKKSDTTFSVTGDLTIHGVTKSVTADFERVGTGKDPWGGIRTGAEAVLTIKRSDYGMTFMQDGLGDDVKLFVSLEGVKK